MLLRCIVGGAFWDLAVLFRRQRGVGVACCMAAFFAFVCYRRVRGEWSRCGFLAARWFAGGRYCVTTQPRKVVGFCLNALVLAVVRSAVSSQHPQSSHRRSHLAPLPLLLLYLPPPSTFASSGPHLPPFLPYLALAAVPYLALGAVHGTAFVSPYPFHPLWNLRGVMAMAQTSPMAADAKTATTAGAAAADAVASPSSATMVASSVAPAAMTAGATPRGTTTAITAAVVTDGAVAPAATTAKAVASAAATAAATPAGTTTDISPADMTDGAVAPATAPVTATAVAPAAATATTMPAGTATAITAAAVTGGAVAAVAAPATATAVAVPAAVTATVAAASPVAASMAMDTAGAAGGAVVTPVSVAVAVAPTPAPVGVSYATAAAAASTPAGGTAAFAALQEAHGAAARARARAASGAKSLAMQRFGRYLNAVNGRSVSAKTLEAAAEMVANASALEDGNDHLQVVIHLSGVSAGGDLGWESLYGQGTYVDPDVLRVFGQAHQFCRGRDVLSRNPLAAPARLVGTLHRGGDVAPPPSSPAPLPVSAEEEEHLEVFTSPADSVLPPPFSIQRLARQVARARSASRSESSLDAGSAGGGNGSAATLSSTDALGGEASGDNSNGSEGAVPLLPYVLECMSAPDVETPHQSALAFMKDLILNRRAPVQLLRATLRAVVIFFAMHFGLAPRIIQEGFSRWWAHRIVADQTSDGTVVAPRWPMGVKVPTRFLPSKMVKSACKSGEVRPAEEPLDEGAADLFTDQTRLTEEFVTIFLDAIPSSEHHRKHEEAVAALLLLWCKEPRCHSVMKHEVFKADHAALRRKAAPKRKSPSTAAVPVDGVPAGLAPRPTEAAGFAGGESAVLATRAAARLAAGATAPSTTPVQPVQVLTAKSATRRPARWRRPPSSRRPRGALPRRRARPLRRAWLSVAAGANRCCIFLLLSFPVVLVVGARS